MYHSSDLKAEYPVRIETHAHTKPVSPCSEIPPEILVRDYLALGYQAVVVTNHFRLNDPNQTATEAVEQYLSDYHATCRAAAGTGLRILLGLEINFPENRNDYLVYGVDVDDLEEAYSYLPRGEQAFYTGFHNEKRLILQAHPFRDAMVRADPRFLDGIEVFNMHPNHNSRISFANRWAKENDFIVTAGTDFHHPGHEGMAALCAKTCPADSFEFAELLRSRDYLFDLCGSIVLPY